MGVVGAPVLAQASESNKAAAEALFNEARNLMTAGRYDEALAKLKASQNLDPALGTLLNIAECYEKLGRTASAWAQYREIVSLARQAGSKEREEFAENKAKGLEPRISKLAINLKPGAGDASGMKITRDGEVVSAAELAVPIPVDPGKHVIEVTAPGKEPWSLTVEIGEGSSVKEIEIPALSNAEGGGDAGGDVPGDKGPSPQESSDGSGQRIAGLVVAGVGVVGVGLGAFFGLQASSSWSDAKKECTAYPYGCSPKGISLQKDAESQGTISTIGFIVGGVGLAGGAVLFFTAGSGKKESVSLGVGPGNVTIKGTF
jgi:hypothetical protein